MAFVCRRRREALDGVRGNVASLLHDRYVDPDDAVAYAERWASPPPARAKKVVQFQTDLTWRAYIFFATSTGSGSAAFTAGDPSRFERLITEQLLPSDLELAA